MTSQDDHLISASNRCESKWVLDYLNRKIWSKEEDELLLLLVSEHKRKWKKIASFFPNKKPSQCIYRYQILKGLPIYNKINKKDHKKIKQCVLENNNSFDEIKKLFKFYKTSTLLNKYKEITNNKESRLANCSSIINTSESNKMNNEQLYLNKYNNVFNHYCCCLNINHLQTYLPISQKCVSSYIYKGLNYMKYNNIKVNENYRVHSNTINKYLLVTINHCVFLLNVYKLYRKTFFVYNLNHTFLQGQKTKNNKMPYVNKLNFLRNKNKRLLFILLRSLVGFCKNKQNENIDENDFKYLLSLIEQCHEAILYLINITKVNVSLNINND